MSETTGANAARPFAGATAVVVCAAAREGGMGPAGGANPHLGAAIAQALAERGARVCVVDDRREALQALVDAQRAAGHDLTAFDADPCDAAALQRVAAEIAQTHGAVRVLVNAHAEPRVCRIADSPPELWARAMQMDLLGPVYASQAFLPLLRQAPGASVVHIGSIDGLLGNPRIPAYSAAKGGLVPLTHVMADEFAAHGIRVNCVARGMTQPAGAPPHAPFAPLIAQTPLARPALPQEVAAAVCFLASDEASYINGVVLPVDGGRIGITPGTRQHTNPPAP